MDWVSSNVDGPTQPHLSQQRLLLLLPQLLLPLRCHQHRPFVLLTWVVGPPPLSPLPCHQACHHPLQEFPQQLLLPLPSQSQTALLRRLRPQQVLLA